jgi:hypothetical protein
MHPSRRWRASRSRARSPRMHHASYPVFVHRPAALDWASNRSQSSRRSSGQEQSSLLLETPLPPFAPRLAATHLPFSLPSALRSGVRRTAGAAKPGHRTCTYEVTRHARRTRESSGDGRGFIRPVACSAGLGASTEEYTINLQMCCAASGTGSSLISRSARGAR